MPSPKIEALLKAPPKNVSIKPKMPSAGPFNLDGSTPGSTIKEPNRKMIRNPIVFKILILKSSIEKMFLTVEINFFINSNCVYRTTRFFNCFNS